MLAPTNPEHVAIVDRLKGALLALPVEGVLTHTDAKRIAGRDVQTKHRYLMVKARNEAEKELGCLFESVRGVGVSRLPAERAPEVGLHTVKKVRRASRRGAGRLERVNSNSLTDSGRKRVIAYRSMLGAIAMMADGNKARTLAAVADPAKPIPPKDVLLMFA
jgi:hypothetical protein